jgi:hypothetical protein
MPRTGNEAVSASLFVEPGVIATPIFGKVGQPPTNTNCPQRRHLMERVIRHEELTT